MSVTRYNGYAWRCPVASCRRQVRALSVVVLELEVAKHVEACRRRASKDASRVDAARKQLGLFGGDR